MALPAYLRPGLVPSEAELLSATATHVSILPLQRLDRVRLLQGVYGPFRPPAQASVPLWLAVSLKGKRRARIVPPEWLGVEPLKALLRAETSAATFAPVPLHYVAVATLLLDAASDDIPEADAVRALLKDLREARQSKVFQGLNSINPYHLEMPNLSLSEIAELKPFFIKAFNDLRFLQPSVPGLIDDLDDNGGGFGGGRGVDDELDFFPTARRGADVSAAATRGDETGAGGFAGLEDSFQMEDTQEEETQEVDAADWRLPDPNAAVVQPPPPQRFGAQPAEQAQEESMQTDMDLF